MIQNHYELNIATNGRHYARVHMPPELTKEQAQKRSELIAMALSAYNNESDGSFHWSFNLAQIECVGRDVLF